MTREEYTARNSSIPVFQCVMGAIDGYEQAILSSGASILGFIPTVMALLGCSSDQLLRLHAAVCMRVCLRDTNELKASVSSDFISGQQISWIANIRSRLWTKWKKAKSVINSISVWDRDLTREGLKFELRYPLFASCSKVCIELLNNANFALGTAVFSSMALVSGHVAIKVLCVYALVSAITRMLVTWVLGD
ncbi:hypothetical protein FH972_025253 [Carpinus fangiana]|uniref:Uncharacterized protein n=1 Tax=Carpinus fangiana TaxID=176857 RepID=A0A5N6L0I4_9ROSI|nr:hypothetical protein FH972_025253 [Carpinus fangiana]